MLATVLKGVPREKGGVEGGREPPAHSSEECLSLSLPGPGIMYQRNQLCYSHRWLGGELGEELQVLGPPPPKKISLLI